MTDKRYIRHVHTFANGVAMVFDQYGQQMPEYQGMWDDVRDKVLANKREETDFDLSFGEWTPL